MVSDRPSSASPFDAAQFLRESNLTEEQFAETALKWDCLLGIGRLHAQACAALQTAASYISERLQTVAAVHSLKVRIKNPEHLLAKIIRKKLAKPELDFQTTTYEDLITDLIGIRTLHLFKHEWREIHDFINGTWELYEPPVAYVREGDPPELLTSFRDAGCEVKDHPFGYRSLHYVVKSQPDKKVRLAEIQVRTIFEEGWSEIDHRVRYPLHSSNPFLAHFLTIFNRLAGSADEMGTFVQALSVHFREQAVEVAGIQARMEESEQEVHGAVSRLKISEKERSALQKQIQSMQSSLRAAVSAQIAPNAFTAADYFKGIGSAPYPITASDFTTKGFLTGLGVSAPAFGIWSQATCTKCGNIYSTGELLTFGPSVCPECRLVR